MEERVGQVRDKDGGFKPQQDFTEADWEQYHKWQAQEKKQGARKGRSLALQLIDELMNEEDTRIAMVSKLRVEAKTNTVAFLRNIVMPLIPKTAIEGDYDDGVPKTIRLPFGISSLEVRLKTERQSDKDAVEDVMIKIKKKTAKKTAKKKLVKRGKSRIEKAKAKTKSTKKAVKRKLKKKAVKKN